MIKAKKPAKPARRTPQKTKTTAARANAQAKSRHAKSTAGRSGKSATQRSRLSHACEEVADPAASRPAECSKLVPVSIPLCVTGAELKRSRRDARQAAFCSSAWIGKASRSVSIRQGSQISLT